MKRLRDVLDPPDHAHLRRILGEKEDPTFGETKRHSRVFQIVMDATYVADDAIAPFQALEPDERQRLMSDVVWRVTCEVEGSITKSPGKGAKLEGGFRLTKAKQDGKDVYCVEKKG